MRTLLNVYAVCWCYLFHYSSYVVGKSSIQRDHTYVTTKYFKDNNCGELVPNTKQIGPEYCHVLDECFPLGGTSYYGKYQYHPRVDRWNDGQVKGGNAPSKLQREQQQDGYDTFIMLSYLDSNCLITNVQTPASIIASNCPPGVYDTHASHTMIIHLGKFFGCCKHCF